MKFLFGMQIKLMMIISSYSSLISANMSSNFSIFIKCPYESLTWFYWWEQSRSALKLIISFSTLKPAQMAEILQTICWNAFSWMKIHTFWCLFLKVQLTIYTCLAPSHYLNHYWPISPMPFGVTSHIGDILRIDWHNVLLICVLEIWCNCTCVNKHFVMLCSD